MKATEVFRQKLVLKHRDDTRLAIFEVAIWRVPTTTAYPEGIKYRAWLSEGGRTVFGFDNHKPKAPHLHIGDQEIGYVFRGIAALKQDVIAMILQEGFIYEIED
jgi:hypothetical protein